MKYLVVLLAFIIAAPLVRAQAEYRFAPGYVVIVTGDTLWGEVALLPELLATQQVLYRPSSAAAARTFRPGHARAYAVGEGKRYVSRVIAPADGFPAEPLFLLPLVEGGLRLYAFSYDERTTGEQRRTLGSAPERFAIGAADGALHALYLRQERVATGAGYQRRAVPQYLRPLAIAFADCPAEQRRLEGLPFRQRDITEAVVRYNTCVGSEAAVATSASAPTAPDLAVGLGVRLGAGAYTLTDDRASRGAGEGLAFTAGLQAVIRPLILSPRLSLPVELFLASASVGEGWDAREFDARDFDRLRMGLAIGGRYGLPAGALEPFAGVGVHTARLFGKKKGYYIPFPLPYSGEHWFPTWESGLYLEAGATGPTARALGRVGVGVRYEITGLGYPNPFMRHHARWESRSLSAFTTIRLR